MALVRLSGRCSRLYPGVSPLLMRGLPTSAADEMKNFWIKNETKGRPISPHLAIWKWQLPMNLSLFHRISGCALSTVIYTFSYGIFLLPMVVPGDFTTYLTFIKDLQLPSALITAGKLALALPFTYHAANGIRHLAFDTGRGFGLKELYMSGYAVLGLSILSAGFLAWL